jgi:hypothetical protein
MVITRDMIRSEFDGKPIKVISKPGRTQLTFLDKEDKTSDEATNKHFYVDPKYTYEGYEYKNLELLNETAETEDNCKTFKKELDK